MADSNVFDRVLEADAVGGELMRAVSERRIELIITHVQELEMADTPDREKRERLLVVPRRIIGLSTFVLGYARVGIDRLGEGEVYNKIAKATPERLSDVKDGMIADTAVAEGLPLVTEDKRLRVRGLEAGAVVWSVEELLLELRRVAPGSSSST